MTLNLFQRIDTSFLYLIKSTTHLGLLNKLDAADRLYRQFEVRRQRIHSKLLQGFRPLPPCLSLKCRKWYWRTICIWIQTPGLGLSFIWTAPEAVISTRKPFHPHACFKHLALLPWSTRQLVLPQAIFQIFSNRVSGYLKILESSLIVLSQSAQSKNME